MKTELVPVTFLIKKRPAGMNNCSWCFEPPEFYMLQDDLWRALGLAKDENACLNCIQAVLGRRLRREDFKPNIPLNRGWLDLVFGHKNG